MRDLELIWDRQKNAVNKRKHGVSFEEAETVFYDENARHMPDAAHSSEEERFLLLGMSAQLRVLVVCHCFRESESIIRIISARRATRREREQYEESQ